MEPLATTDGGKPPAELDVERVRADFPALLQQVNGQPLCYLDSAATAQTPACVLSAMQRCYLEYHANVNRGAHSWAGRATQAYEAARASVQRFLNARDAEEVVFSAGCTASINLVAYAFGELLSAGDEIIVSALEHHSNLLPWQALCRRRGLALKVIPIDAAGELVLEAYRALLGPRTRLVAVSHVSNALGTLNPLPEVIQLAHAAGAVVLVDGAQAAPRCRVDVRALDCDFYAFSGHKVYGPFGIGVLYGKRALLERMPPFLSGGGMVDEVSLAHASFAGLPRKFEAGTPNLAGAVGLGVALDYLEGLGREAVERHERRLLQRCEQLLLSVDGVRLIGTAKNKLGVCSFLVEGIHPHDVSTVLDQRGIALRAGHHCAAPVMDHFGVPATLRASFAAYNDVAELERLAQGLHEAKRMFRR